MMPEAQSEQKTVFISYRRSVASFIARAVFMDLRGHGYDVFMDVESIDSGQFDTIILRQIEARAHFVVILTPGTVERCAEPGDWLRREIEYAMEKQRNIVPLLVSNFSFAGTEQHLTGKLSELSGFSGLPVFHEYFDEAMERMRTRFLKQPVYGMIRAAPASEQAEVQRKIEEVAVLPPPTKEELSAEEYLNMGLELSDNSEQEIAFYTEAIRLNPQLAFAYFRRAQVRESKGDIEGAVTDYNEAIRIDPEDAIFHTFRGMARGERGDLDGALADYDEAIYLDPISAFAYPLRGKVRQELGDLKGAFADYNEAIRLDPSEAFGYMLRGFLRGEQGDFDGAIADYNKAIRFDPKNTFLYTQRSFAREMKGDLKGAIADYQKYLDLGGGQEYGDQAEIEVHIQYLQEQLSSQA